MRIVSLSLKNSILRLQNPMGNSKYGYLWHIYPHTLFPIIRRPSRHLQTDSTAQPDKESRHLCIQKVSLLFSITRLFSFKPKGIENKLLFEKLTILALLR